MKDELLREILSDSGGHRIRSIPLTDRRRASLRPSRTTSSHADSECVRGAHDYAW